MVCSVLLPLRVLHSYLLVSNGKCTFNLSSHCPSIREFIVSAEFDGPTSVCVVPPSEIVVVTEDDTLF
jgi:hypothetical protein